MLPYGRQSLDDADIAAVCDVLRSDFLTCGPIIEEFEAAFAQRVGSKYAVAVSSATAALHLGVRVLGIGPHDRVVTSPNTFLASANCAAYVGAVPDFADIDPISHNLSASAVQETWKGDTKALVAVDYAGQAADLPALSNLARTHGAAVIEDASHGVGTAFSHEQKVYKVGGHAWADVTVFSFHPVKTMTTGEGGMLVTDKEEIASRARKLRSHGIERKEFCGLGCSDNTTLREHGPWYHEMHDLGYNYRITDFQCALGLSQLKKLDSFILRRREIVSRYNEAFADLGWLSPPGLSNPADRDLISWHLYTVEMDFLAIGKTRTQVMGELRSKGIGTQVLYIPVHLQPWYRQNYGYAIGKCPVAEKYYSRALSLPLFPAMTDKDVVRVIETVRALYA